MRVTVYQATDKVSRRMVLFVYPSDTEPQVAEIHKAFDWKHLASTTMDDRLFVDARPIVEAEINERGYAFVTLK